LLVGGTEKPGTEAAGCRFASHVDERCGERVEQTGIDRAKKKKGGGPGVGEKKI
jgi:hypothetical protein